METSADSFCTLCDPTSIKANEWCSECDAFLCPECFRHHSASKTSNTHSTISIKNYEELPDFVKTLTYICEDHDERIDLFCPVHNCPCCIRCVLMSHKSCDGVAPLKDFTQDSKNSSTMKDIEQTLADMQSFISKLIGDKENNKQEIHTQQNKILDEIRQIRMSLNKHLDQIEHTLINSLKETVSESIHHIDGLIHELKDLNDRIDKISNDLSIIKSHATDLQTFLSMLQMTSKIVDEEKYIHELGESSKLIRKAIVFEAEVEDFMNKKSFGDVQVMGVRGSIDYVKEKDKQAQIIGAPQRTMTNIYLKQTAMLEIKLAEFNTQISGCDVLANGYLLFSEYNRSSAVDRVTLCDNKGRLIQRLTGPTLATFYDVTNIDEYTCAVSTESSVNIINISARTIVSKIENRRACYGNSYKDGLAILCIDGEGIRKYNMRTKENELLVKENIKKFSYVCRSGNRIIYTLGTEAVKCCDMDGKVIWKYEDTSILRSPRGVAVDKNGYCFVNGEQSGSTVVISPDGKSSKEVCNVPSPRAICYDETRHKIIVCNNSKAYLFQISKHE